MKTQRLDKSYGGRKVVNDVNFSLPKNSVISFIGPNGAGKSTVMNMITRLISRDMGDIEIDEIDIKNYKSNELAKKLAILTQSNHLQMNISVYDLIAFGRFPYSGSRLNEEDKKHIEQAISYMELEEYRDHFINELSGGQRQRAFIAMVIAQDTEYIFLDEPTNSLDVYHASKLMKLVRKLCDDLGKTVILVLHDINFASVYSDYIGAFKGGNLAKFGSVEEVITKDVLKNLYNVDFNIMEIEGKLISNFY